jgi:hypothetical protein
LDQVPNRHLQSLNHIPRLGDYLFNDDITTAFCQCKYHLNVISASKGILIDAFLFIATGNTFGNRLSPPSFEPIAQTQMALLTELAKGAHPIPEFPDYIKKVKFSTPPLPNSKFAEARTDKYNAGVPRPPDGQFPMVEYNMHMDNNLYATTGINHMKWAMRCSIAGLQLILGQNAPDLRPCQPDPEKFFRQTVSYEH